MNCSARKSVLAAGLALTGVADAGHEFPFYPSFYPQEITVEALDAQTAAQRLAKGTLHAYAGTVETNPAKTAAVASLGGYVIARVDRDACAAAPSLKQALPKGAVWHPYPVTPFHADYLHHADRAEVVTKSQKSTGASAKVEVVDITTLMAKASARYNGWSGPSWLRRGWFHAYLLLAPAAPDVRIENAAQRLMRGDYRSLEERIELERNLVALLQSGCERVVLGYTVRREHYAVEYSAGVENVGYDAFDGLASAIFPRTVKLRDFPWNGWLNVAAPAAPSSAWNPVAGGFGDAFGRLVWSALSDPAFLPAPHGGAWIENRVSASVEKSEKGFAVPEDALFSAGRGKTATTRIVYRVRNSAFHDGTSMNFADVVYAYALANPEQLRGVRLLRLQTETLAFGEDKLSYEVPVIEVYLDGASGEDAATVAPPWTTLPWHLLALFDEAARRGYLKLADFDPVRDTALVRRLGELARELEERGHVPRALLSHVSAKEARERYRRLREFHAAHGHWLVTNGPYLLSRWDGAKAVLGVFRDPTYPKGLGSFNAYAVPLKAHVTRIERRGDGALVHTEAEWLERLGRDTRIVRGSFAQRLAERLTGAGAPVCHYMLVRRDGGIAAAGAVRAGAEGSCRLQLKTPGHRLAVAAGVISSGNTPALGPVAEELRVLTLFNDGCTDFLFDKAVPNPKYTFRVTNIQSADGVTAAIGAATHWPKARRVASIQPDYSYGRNVFEHFVLALGKLLPGIEVVSESWPKLGTTDFTSHITKILSTRPDLLITGVWGGDYVAFYKQALRYGLFDKMKVATTLAFGGYPHAIGKDHPDGVLAGVHANYHFLYPSAERWPINKSFVERYYKRFKEYPSFEADGAYVALYLYKQAVEKANQLVGGWPDDEAIIAMLEGAGIDTPAGYLYIRADNHQGYKDAVTGLSKNLPGYDFPVWDPASIVSIPIRSITAPPNWPKPGKGHNESTAAADWIKKTWPAARAA